MFWGHLALALGKTIGELSELLTEEELEYWRVYFLHHPFDDLHRYHRPAAAIVSAQAGRQASAAFTSTLDLLAPKPKAQSKPLRLARVIQTPKE